MADAYGDHIYAQAKRSTPGERYFYESRFRDLETPIVDLGPGRCTFTRQGLRQDYSVDNSPAVVDRYGSEGLDIRLGSAYDLPFEDASVSGFYCRWLLEHLDNPVRCLTEMRRVLHPGGYACFIISSAESLNRGFYDDYTHVRPSTHASMKQLAEDAGFPRPRTSGALSGRGLWSPVRRRAASLAPPPMPALPRCLLPPRWPPARSLPPPWLSWTASPSQLVGGNPTPTRSAAGILVTSL